MKRRRLLEMAAAIPVLGRAQTRARPNFVILFTDDQRFDTIRALGNHEIRTPNMDRLCARGVAFTHAAIMGGTQGAVCMPSRAMLMTGQTLFRAARNTHSTPGDNAEPGPFHLFPEMLRQNGYATFATGKWHNGPALFSRCFTSGDNIFFGGMSDHIGIPVQPFDSSGEYAKDRARKSEKFSSELFADSAIGFLESHRGSEPFLLYCAFTAPHDPRTAPKRFADMYSPSRLSTPKNFLPEHPFDNGELKIRDEMLAPFPRTPDIVRRHLADYYAMISEVDHELGRILDALDRSPHSANTYIVFAGDNGLAVGQHGLMGKQNVYEHSVRVALVIAGPGVPKAHRSDALVYTCDIFPTLCHWSGLAVPMTVEGESLVPFYTGARTQGRESVFFAYRNYQRAVRTRDWKLIRYTVNGSAREQLFHLAEDPIEARDLSADSNSAGMRRDLAAQLEFWQKRVGDPLLGKGLSAARGL